MLLSAAFLTLTGTTFSQEKDSTVAAGEEIMVSGFRLQGNKVTRDRIILREMMVHPGQVLPKDRLMELLARSRENLMNTTLFNFVTISLDENTPGEVMISIDVIERWYIWPIPILKTGDRNFNVWWETKDFSRLSYGLYIDWRNFTGSRDNLLTRLQFGYDQIFDAQYSYPYLNKKQTIGIGFGGGLHGNHEVAYQTSHNKQEFYREEDGYAMKNQYAFGQVLIRPSIYNTHLFELRYDHDEFADSLVILNPEFSTDQLTRLGYFTVHYKYKSDHRDFAPYPLQGYYFDIEVFKIGLWQDESGSPDIFRIQTTFRKYWKFRPWLYYANGLNCTFADDGRQPYFLNKAIGYERDIVRGYEYYVVDGNNFGIFKSNLKFALISQKNGEFSFIRSEKFGKFYYGLYANLFLDLGYAYNPYHSDELENELENELLLGFGTGIDFVTYYDIVLRLEFSVNKMMESGIFFHINAPI
jgi:outer membrane protein assembly factor BamA